MLYSEFQFEHTKEYYKIKELYEIFKEKINTSSNIQIRHHDIVLDVFNGDVADDIKWSWAGNQKTLDYFLVFFDSIKLNEKLKSIYSNKFTIRGASFITINKKFVIDSKFHLDAGSQYDTNDSNILTILFPLYLDKQLGNLEYKSGREIKVYKYKTNNIIVWDSCKFIHRTQPYNSPNKTTRVLVSVNLTSNILWSKKTLENCLLNQGAKFLDLK